MVMMGSHIDTVATGGLPDGLSALWPALKGDATLGMPGSAPDDRWR